jgi:hypothetical protein
VLEAANLGKLALGELQHHLLEPCRRHDLHLPPQQLVTLRSTTLHAMSVGR